MEPFLAINKKYYGTGLRSVDLHIVAFIDNFQRNNKPCYITNQWISEQIGEAESMVKRSLERLEKFNVIKRHTVFRSGNGRNNRHRLLVLNDIKEWKLPQKTTQETTSFDEWMEHNDQTIIENGGGNDEWTAHNEQTIDEWMEHNEQTIDKNDEWMAHSARLIDEWTAHSAPIKEEEPFFFKRKKGLFDSANADSQSPTPADAGPPAAQPIYSFSFKDKLIIRMKLKSGIKKSEVIKDLKENNHIEITIKELDQIWDEYKGTSGLQRLKELVDKEKSEIEEQQEQDKAIQRKLTGLDDLMFALDDRGISTSKEEVIAKCKEYYFSNRSNKYKWSCADLIEIVKSKYSKLDDTFDSVIKEFIKIKNNYA